MQINMNLKKVIIKVEGAKEVKELIIKAFKCVKFINYIIIFKDYQDQQAYLFNIFIINIKIIVPIIPNNFGNKLRFINNRLHLDFKYSQFAVIIITVYNYNIVTAIIIKYYMKLSQNHQKL